ncbi:hypothetical protein, partial [Aeromonas veronii]|uniref:hypothetical protein n=1 Tax=Aeromonas veronii TaxID=654 RepID=UPI003003B3EC
AACQGIRRVPSGGIGECRTSKLNSRGTVSAECFLKDQTIRFSQPKAFNDPFELQPEFHVLDEGFIEGEARPCQFVIHGCQSSYENYLLANHTAQTQARKLDGKSIFSQLNEKIGILCLTQG